MVAKYAEVMDLDSLSDPDHYLLMKRIKQLYVEFYKPKNIVKFMDNPAEYAGYDRCRLSGGDRYHSRESIFRAFYGE